MLPVMYQKLYNNSIIRYTKSLSIPSGFRAAEMLSPHINFITLKKKNLNNNSEMCFAPIDYVLCSSFFCQTRLIEPIINLPHFICWKCYGPFFEIRIASCFSPIKVSVITLINRTDDDNLVLITPTQPPFRNMLFHSGITNFLLSFESICGRSSDFGSFFNQRELSFHSFHRVALVLYSKLRLSHTHPTTKNYSYLCLRHRNLWTKTAIDRLHEST